MQIPQPAPSGVPQVAVMFVPHAHPSQQGSSVASRHATATPLFSSSQVQLTEVFYFYVDSRLTTAMHIPIINI